ncbi:glutathione S-transferase [Pseudaestuariivita rosea]|uniref:glutathione S-transferase n=1 Tax=Pseudaestuariivita rosea TaxID=2763263 RepID=UPI001ABB3A93|nr:glutathione S-transferase [Pseudaestuariivita rosea]
MKLLLAGPSPFVRKVLVLLHETGQMGDVELQKVAANPADPDPNLTAVNPIGKIPALVRDDGPAIYDSRVICRYLDARVHAGLYPETHLWETLTLEATADAIMEAAVLMVYEKRFRPEKIQSEEWLEAQWAKVSRAVSVVNTRWMSHLSGSLDAAHIAIACALAYLDFRHDDRSWRHGNDALTDWYARFADRDSMKATTAEKLDTLVS